MLSHNESVTNHPSTSKWESVIVTLCKSKENITFAIPYKAVNVNSLTRLQAMPACR